MNGKKAKKLRSEARALTVGYPVVAYTKRRFSTELKYQCTRFVYKQLKKLEDRVK